MRTLILLIIFSVITLNSNAQSNEITNSRHNITKKQIRHPGYVEQLNGDDDLAFLKNETTLNVEFLYENMAVGEYDKESDYVKYRILQLDKGVPGEGEIWKSHWFGSRSLLYHLNYVSEANDALKKSSIKFTLNDTTSKYYLKIEVKETRPGWTITGSGTPAYLFLVLSIVERENEDTLASFSQNYIPGINGLGTAVSALDPQILINEAYKKGAKEFGLFLSKKIR